MFRQLSEIIDAPPQPRGGRKRTGEPVRRHSHRAGHCEGVFWRGITRREAHAILLAARRYEVVTRQPRCRNGALGTVALEVLDLMANMVDYRTGRLDPSIDTLMRHLRRSRDAIVRALAALRAHGFLDWLRRYVPTGNEGRGPQVRQTSNAYRLSLPARALRMMAHMLRPSPPPDDFSHAQEQRRADLDAYRRTLSLADLPLFDVDDPGIAAALSKLGSLVMERESSRRAESPI